MTTDEDLVDAPVVEALLARYRKGSLPLLVEAISKESLVGPGGCHRVSVARVGPLAASGKLRVRILF